MALRTEDMQKIISSGGKVVGPNGKIGGIGQVYLDDQTGEPAWVTTSTGLFGSSESFVPLQGATLRGDDIVVEYDKDVVKDAPRIDADGSLSPAEEGRLYAHYGVADRYADYDDDVATRGRHTDTERDAAGTVGHDTSGPTTDDAMTRSEEQLRVGTRTEESSRARLRKFVVTENVSQTVPVSHEEVRVEREPITDANIADALDGPAISEEEHEVVLHEERPVVQKDTVPVERVKLGTETVTEQVTVNEEVRKEQIDSDLDVDESRRR